MTALSSTASIVTSRELNELVAASWCGNEPRDWDPISKHGLVYLCAYRERSLVGFVNVAWDGGVHSFILDTTVHPVVRRCGIGRRLVLRAASEAGDRNHPTPERLMSLRSGSSSGSRLIPDERSA